ncbi:MAG TPA: N-acetylmuramoyl-L-alanine amidase [Candidatus Udaeobacter sp.]|nr:N-acetylmuramoyl-L-alanine amidase [Candidatus Udaeobacter sp.]
MPTNLYRLRLFAAGLLIAFLGTLSPAQARRAPQDSGSTTTVVIDAGHGGYDRGGIPGQRVAEKEMTLDVAQRLKKTLAASGYRVVMTRDSDMFVPLGTRVAIANSYSNAIFVSIHFNSAKRSGAGGIETYFYSRDSLPLASAIHYFVAGGAPSSNRNVRRRGYYVLRKTSVPAVLVECGFLTNPTEAAYAQTASYRQRLAEEIAAGVRGRNSVSSPLTTTRVATNESIPLQPYIDQTKVAKSDRHRSKRSHKKSARRKKKSSKPAGSEAKASSKDQEG